MFSFLHKPPVTPNSWIELHGQVFHLFSSILYGCARILQWSIPKSSKSSIAGKYERNRYKFKFPEAPASATWAQPLSPGPMHDRMHGPTCGIAEGGHHCFGGGRRPPHSGGCCHIWDHISYHAWHQNLTVAPSPELQET